MSQNVYCFRTTNEPNSSWGQSSQVTVSSVTSPNIEVDPYHLYQLGHALLKELLCCPTERDVTL
ncbi:MAG: hypothetical protein KatS3mg049_0688 [Caldilinea sp.]|jgi:hypothetical protein|nr:MAG: hypothetical protein KatS3mg049_0688 [Caldilinea sp.]